MLNIKTVKNLLITDESKDGFCFRSSCSQTLKTSQLATEMADWNSSFTEADYLGMLSVMETIVTKYLAKGYNVTLPFGTLPDKARSHRKQKIYQSFLHRILQDLASMILKPVRLHSRSVREFTFALMTPSLPLLISLSISAKSPFLRL